MFPFHCQRLIRQSRSTFRAYLTIPHFGFIQTQSLKTISESTNEQSLTVYFLVKSCGLSLESANLASKNVNIKSTKKADSVLELFRAHGFMDTQITKLVTKFPQILQSNSDEILKPKIEYFKSLGFSTQLLGELISKQPWVLSKSLENRIIPSCSYIKNYVGTDKNLITVFKKCSRLVAYNVEKLMEPNINILRAHDIPQSNISALIMVEPSIVALNTERFGMCIGKAKNLGFDPMTKKFVLALRMMTRVTEANWEQKIEAYKSFGLSEQDFLATFKLQPLFIYPSEKKIRKLMQFFMTNLNWKPSVVCKYPNLMMLGLEKSIIPRCSVVQVLMSKGVVKKDVNIPAILISNSKTFLNRFVVKYEDKIPEVVEAHQGKIVFHRFH